ncbi:PrsW family intramembrane metalloprotease [Microbacterium esteraromaticum]|uniref:PrsW family intramembrane metalloprotease n=1 Tax=Microbacterium esteraromaticum TaxID=57043 RepID=UPI001D922C5F|nr:PrsW family intramembrane metalloprotease [Microbacterium esteraromaticum]MBM7467281.1 RsiW-degrading membrane proteinase PrsW (M82 family) [Microbacterium esteraromaticum]
MSFGGQPPAAQPSDPVYGQPPRPLHPQRGDSRGPSREPFPTLLAGPSAYAPPTPAAPAPAPAMPALPMPARRGRSASVWAFGALGFAMLALIAYFALFLGAGASIVGLVLALVPLTIVLTGVRLIDRWEPEPRSLVIFALAWGAVAAVGITLLVDLALTLAVGLRTEFFSAVIQAPVIEEIAKGLGVLLVFVIGRRAFDGPVDGVVYGALVGAGFAFTENIQYFGTSLIDGGAGQLTLTFVLRGLVSPFAHAMFTALTGFAIGLAARRGATTATALGSGALGLLGAVALHAYWNGSSLLGDFLALYLSTQVPLFIGFIVAILALRREEARLTRIRLGDYAAAGWFTPQEVEMLATPGGRRTGLQWASGLRGDRRDVMQQFIRDAAALAAVRQRAITGRDPLAAADEHALLMRTRDARARLLAY